MWRMFIQGDMQMDAYLDKRDLIHSTRECLICHPPVVHFHTGMRYEDYDYCTNCAVEEICIYIE